MDKKKTRTSDGFMPVYKELADIIGPEATFAIFKCMRGQQVTLPKRLYTTDYVLDQINESGGNVDIHKIALEYDYTERYLKQLLKQRK